MPFFAVWPRPPRTAIGRGLWRAGQERRTSASSMDDVISMLRRAPAGALTGASIPWWDKHGSGTRGYLPPA